MSQDNQTPLRQIESFCEALVTHYGDGKDRELRVAAKMLIAALDQFRQHGGRDWPDLVREYLNIAVNNPEKFGRILKINRGENSENEPL